jgi:GNAT superfamily N-acetyltransferase
MTHIRPLNSNDRPQWIILWQAYLRFYRQRLPGDVTDSTFARLVDEKAQPHALVAEQAEKIVGFAHYVFHPSTWSLTNLCYLEDLFVDPSARGAGAGRALIEGVYAAADRVNAGSVYWMTQEFNADARALYDTLAHRTSFIRYER